MRTGLVMGEGKQRNAWGTGKESRGDSELRRGHWAMEKPPLPRLGDLTWPHWGCNGMPGTVEWGVEGTQALAVPGCFAAH